MEGIERTASSTDSAAVFDAAMEVASSLTATTTASTARPSTVESSADATSSGGSADSVSAASAASACRRRDERAALRRRQLEVHGRANARRPVAASGATVARAAGHPLAHNRAEAVIAVDGTDLGDRRVAARRRVGERARALAHLREAVVQGGVPAGMPPASTVIVILPLTTVTRATVDSRAPRRRGSARRRAQRTLDVGHRRRRLARPTTSDRVDVERDREPREQRERRGGAAARAGGGGGNGGGGVDGGGGGGGVGGGGGICGGRGRAGTAGG